MKKKKKYIYILDRIWNLHKYQQQFGSRINETEKLLPTIPFSVIKIKNILEEIGHGIQYKGIPNHMLIFTKKKKKESLITFFFLKKKKN